MVVRFTDTLVHVTEGESEEICVDLDSEFSISDNPAVTIELTPEFVVGMYTLCKHPPLCMSGACVMLGLHRGI